MLGHAALRCCIAITCCKISRAVVASTRRIRRSIFYAQDPSGDAADRLLAHRWYPSATLMPDGRILITSGQDADASTGCACGTPFYLEKEAPAIGHRRRRSPAQRSS